MASQSLAENQIGALRGLVERNSHKLIVDFAKTLLALSGKSDEFIRKYVNIGRLYNIPATLSILSYFMADSFAGNDKLMTAFNQNPEKIFGENYQMMAEFFRIMDEYNKDDWFAVQSKFGDKKIPQLLEGKESQLLDKTFKKKISDNLRKIGLKSLPEISIMSSKVYDSVVNTGVTTPDYFPQMPEMPQINRYVQSGIGKSVEEIVTGKMTGNTFLSKFVIPGVDSPLTPDFLRARITQRATR